MNGVEMHLDDGTALVEGTDFHVLPGSTVHITPEGMQRIKDGTGGTMDVLVTLPVGSFSGPKRQRKTAQWKTEKRRAL